MAGKNAVVCLDSAHYIGSQPNFKVIQPFCGSLGSVLMQGLDSGLDLS